MKKITEELNRYNSINKYISEQFGGSLNEEESRIEKIYRNIITNVQGPGTKLDGPSGLLAWIKTLKSYDDFTQLDARIKQFKVYKDFADMVNSEFDPDDSAEIMEVIKHLRSIGVNNGHSGTAQKYKFGTYVVKGPSQAKTGDVDSKNTTTDEPSAVTNTKQPAKISPVLQQTIEINKQIQQKIGVTPTGKLTNVDLEKITKMLTPKT